MELAQWNIKRWAVACAAFVAVLCVLYYCPVWNGKDLEGSWFNDAVYVFGPAFALWVGVKRAIQTRGNVTFLGGSAAYGLYAVGALGLVLWPRLVGPLAYPSMFDWMYVVTYVSALIGILWATTNKSFTYLLDGLIISASILFITWDVVMDPIVRAFDGNTLATVLSMSNPVFDVMLVTMSILAIQRGQTVLSRTMLLVFVGAMTVDTIGDMIWAYMGMARPFPNAAIPLWIASSLANGIAMMFPVPKQTHGIKAIGLRFMLLPYVPPVAATAAGIFMLVQHHDVSTATWILGAIAAGCLFVRQLIAIFENVDISRQLENSIHLLQAREMELEHLALHDPLTSLPNRRYLNQRIVDVATGHERFAVLLLDVDNFKTVNDGMGHDIGDELLIQIAQNLSRSIRAGDVVVRLGGDEFAVLLRDAGREEGLVVAERIRRSFITPLDLRGHTWQCGVSIGLAMGSGMESFDNVMRQADIAMYERKRTEGKGGVAVFSGI